MALLAENNFVTKSCLLLWLLILGIKLAKNSAFVYYFIDAESSGLLKF